MADSPTTRSLKVLRAEGYQVAVVEKFVRFPPPGHRVDLYGFADLLAVRAGQTLAVQACAATDHARRVDKVRAAPGLALCLAAGWQVEVFSWRKSKKSRRWELRRVVVEAPADAS